MIEEELQRKLSDSQELGAPPYVPREGRVSVVDYMVSTIIGARRAGKSFRALQLVDELRARGCIDSPAQVCRVDFDNPILGAMTAADLRCIERVFLRRNPDYGLRTPLVFLFDEIHRIAGWEDYVIDLSRNRRWKVIVTGSSSKLLRNDVATALRGKAVSSTVYPLSFSEYLRFTGTDIDLRSSRGHALLRRRFDAYLAWGGYPAMPGVDEHAREALLRDYFDTMVLKDIIQRFDVGKPAQCLQLYHHLLASMGRPCTLKSAYGFLKQHGNATSRDAVRRYIAWAEDAWFLFMAPIHSDSHKEQERNYRKVYCIDWALAIRNSMVWDGSYSRALENMVFIHLLRRYPRVRYYLTRRTRQEVDFVATDARGRSVLAIQVCMDISHADTLRREIEPLAATARYFGIKENLILTMGAEQSFSRSGVKVKALPVWRWLLEEAPAAK
ncbi:MAG TPA: hypothetical protein DCM87_09165 [Planctomycetes bacterium]|nr:hypothetical protein [Planctomycetota bacterium]